jgi:hypothetical protein
MFLAEKYEATFQSRALSSYGSSDWVLMHYLLANEQKRATFLQL